MLASGTRPATAALQASPAVCAKKATPAATAPYRRFLPLNRKGAAAEVAKAAAYSSHAVLKKTAPPANISVAIVVAVSEIPPLKNGTPSSEFPLQNFFSFFGSAPFFYLKDPRVVEIIRAMTGGVNSAVTAGLPGRCGPRGMGRLNSDGTENSQIAIPLDDS
jgi:hypothetical protein